MSSPIAFNGLASGLDTGAIVEAIMAAEHIRVDRLAAKKVGIQKKQTALNDIRTRLTTLQIKAADLTLASKANGKKATVSDSGILNATAGISAAVGSISVNVKQLATATIATSKTALGLDIDQTQVLNVSAAGFTITPTDGTFSINGVEITVDADADTLWDGTANTGGSAANIIDRINASVAGIEAETVTVNGRQRLRITADQDNSIQLGAGSDTSNLLSALKVLGVSPSTTQTGGTLLIGGQTGGGDAAISAINVSGANRSDTYTFSFDGVNQLTLSDGTSSQSVTISGVAAGQSATYDFDDLGIKVTVGALSAAGETATDIGNYFNAQTIITTQTLQSQGSLGTALAAEALSSGRLDTSNDASGLDASGTFEINGVSIDWTNTDSLNNVITRINASAAGVSAAYDAVKDAVILTAKTSGTALISVKDTVGNLMDIFELSTGDAGASATDATAQVTGKNSIISVNGGADFSSSTNSVTGAVSDVTLDLKRAGTTNVTITQDADATVTATKGFIDQFNSALDLIRQKTAYDLNTNTGEILFGDSTVRLLQTRLVGIVSTTFDGAAITDAYRSLGDLGVTFGAVGSAVGTTKTLQLDEAKLRKAIADDPGAVEKVLMTFTSTARLEGAAGANPTAPAADGAADVVVSTSGAPTGHHKSGQYAITSIVSGLEVYLSSVFTPTGGAAQAATTVTGLAAGGSTSMLISGMTLTVADPLPASTTDLINVEVNTLGVFHKLNDYMKQALGVDGAFETRQDSTDSQVKTIDNQISSYERQLEVRRALLERQFAQLEKAMAAMQAQQQSITSALSSLGQQQS